MSSTHGRKDRAPADFYPTPYQCVERFLEAVPLPGGRWLEAGAGNGAIIQAAARPDVQWTAVELRESCRGDLVPLVGAENVVTADFLKSPRPDRRYDVALFNPPYTLALEFVKEAMERADVVAALLRLNFLGSQKRAAFMREFCPDVYVLPDRPSFTGTGTDSCEYAWFIWPPHRRRESGTVTVLSRNPQKGQRGVVSPSPVPGAICRTSSEQIRGREGR